MSYMCHLQSSSVMFPINLGQSTVQSSAVQGRSVSMHNPNEHMGIPALAVIFYRIKCKWNGRKYALKS